MMDYLEVMISCATISIVSQNNDHVSVDLDLDKYSTSISYYYHAEAWEISKKVFNKGYKKLIGKDEK